MCNIAGYSGKNAAAPILIEMLRRQEAFDGSATCGIITIHEGRFYERKVVGNVDTLIETTDALYLPGTVGIAHTRPTGGPQQYNFAHPFIAEGGRLAGITNGTVRFPGYKERAQWATDFLQERGYEFGGGTYLESSSFPKLQNGNFVSCVEARVNLVSYYVNRGYSVAEAMARVASECYTDSVMGIISLDTPDRFYINRITRPAFAVECGDGVMVASCPFAFPDEIGDRSYALPTMQPCAITSGGVELSGIRMSDCEEVGELTEEALEEGYKRIKALLSGKAESPLIFDSIETEVWNNMRDLFPGDHTIIQDASLVYSSLYRLYKEGLLKWNVRLSGKVKRRYYMWIDN